MSKVTQNCKKPVGLLGNIMIKRMNKRHSELVKWGLSQYNFSQANSILDIGCGGGNTIDLLLQKSCAKVFGMDYSPLCVKRAKWRNRKSVKQDRAKIDFGNVQKMHYPSQSFDIVTAVETIYFWQPVDDAMKEVHRVLKEGGKFVIINELSKHKDNLLECQKLENKLQLKVYTEQELFDCLKRAGFAVSSINYRQDWVTVSAIKK